MRRRTIPKKTFSPATTATGQVPHALFRNSLRAWQTRYKTQQPDAKGGAEPAETAKDEGARPS
jgi:hypothetical protein